MANVSVYNMEGNEVGKMDLNDAVFGVEVNEHLVHMAVVAQLANNRQGTQKAKTRSEVSGGGRKPWRQKGTGHARQGSTRAPQWTGGGIVFAPTPRDYTIRLNKKEKRAALKSALILITISTSSAPAFTASDASKALAVVSMAPNGKPTTQQVFTSLPFNSSATSGTKQVFTQTDANSCSFASLQ